jgi:type VI protein secretion system component VasK
MTGSRRTVPVREANDQLVTAVVTAAWGIALVVLLVLRHQLPPGSQWWIWTCVAGLCMGLFGLWYVPRLKRARAAAAARREAASARGEKEPPPGGQRWSSDSNTVSSTDTPGTSTRS